MNKPLQQPRSARFSAKLNSEDVLLLINVARSLRRTKHILLSNGLRMKDKDITAFNLSSYSIVLL